MIGEVIIARHVQLLLYSNTDHSNMIPGFWAHSLELSWIYCRNEWVILKIMKFNFTELSRDNIITCHRYDVMMNLLFALCWELP